jgi:hypothetical protein
LKFINCALNWQLSLCFINERVQSLLCYKVEDFSLFIVMLPTDCFLMPIWIASVVPLYVLIDQFLSISCKFFILSYLKIFQFLLLIPSVFLLLFSYLTLKFCIRNLFFSFFILITQKLIEASQFVCSFKLNLQVFLLLLFLI